MTTEQAIALLEAWPKRVPFYGTDTVVECTACRAYFSDGKAWKAHRRNGTCDTGQVVRNALGIWTTRVRKRIRAPEVAP